MPSSYLGIHSGYKLCIIVLCVLLIGTVIGPFPKTLLRNASAANDNELVLQGLSDQGTFKVELHWQTSNIGKPNSFNIVFRDNDTGTVIEAVRYDWDVTGSALQPSANQRVNQTSDAQQVTFPASGSYTIKISNIEGLGEGIEFHIDVMPEIQDSLMPYALALALVAPIVFARK